MLRASVRKKIKGWLSEIDARIFELLLKQQSISGIAGSTAEIGLHHGKSFIFLCTSLRPDESAYGIDLFDLQNLNLDSSGKGDREILLENLRKFDFDTSKVVLDQRASESVNSSDILSAVGEIRFFSIDGGHWYSTVLNDLELAKECSKIGGIIALDDYLRPEWPDVARGFHVWYEKNSKDFAVIAIGFNKIYLTHPSWVVRYRETLLQDKVMNSMLSKFYSIQDESIPIYTVFFHPDMTKKVRLKNYLKMYHPKIYTMCWAFLKTLPSRRSLIKKAV